MQGTLFCFVIRNKGNICLKLLETWDLIYWDSIYVQPLENVFIVKSKAQVSTTRIGLLSGKYSQRGQESLVWGTTGLTFPPWTEGRAEKRARDLYPLDFLLLSFLIKRYIKTWNGWENPSKLFYCIIEGLHFWHWDHGGINWHCQSLPCYQSAL